MKKLLWLILVGFFVSTACYIYVPPDRGPYGEPRTRPDYRDRYSGYGDIDVAFFYDYLSPYGVWVYYPPYGYVWLPRDVSYRWQPYTFGRWVWTDYGWTFLPRDRWGWAVHHYGRWGWDRSLGWFWVPDTVWAPAWVVWRYGNIYIGWAPVPPGLEFRRDYGFRFRDYDIPGHYWHFIDGRHFLDDDFDRFLIPSERNRTVVNLTSLKGNIRVRDGRMVNEGLDVDEVRRVVRRDVIRYELRDARGPEDQKVEGGNVLIYKPRVNPNESAKPKASIGRSEAERQVTQGRLRRGSLLTPPPDEETLNRDHERENLVLQETQDEEVNEIRRKVEDDKRIARNEDEKKKIDDEAKVKLTEVRKRHDEEKKEVNKRQQEEKTEVSKGRIKKKG